MTYHQNGLSTEKLDDWGCPIIQSQPSNIKRIAENAIAAVLMMASMALTCWLCCAASGYNWQ